MAARPGCSSSVPSLPPPCPKSPPEYPDLYGKRREAAKVQMLEREIGFLEEELKSLDGLQPASRCCKEVTDFVVANSEPLIYQRGNKSCRFWKWLCGMSCFSLSWVCCCCYPACPVHLELPCSCNCNSCNSCKCCSCPSCSVRKCRCCSVRKCRCCSCPKSDCCKGISCCSRSCTFSFPSCPSCSCCSWPSCSCCSLPRSSCCSWPGCSCLKCPKVSCCFSCNCKDICCDPCYLCY
ncbi:G protein gamma domain-containing protein [Psidium guajava]|nr:G protein gamma domain-containing protein [Psidium guajava]